ncbi:ankyrin repeats (3 copies) domain-containing protein [Ditylenchus destructor]|uniref:Ankyrin repeats (3 copies) domain-containing protein n=1 Tax=Ditylenchus destructor TaxID=166010 RepID=A0AAD4R484_9BILA|nr:ankyrin repeats (3 copies) domain-containing protein [Ditylenchus destructor]
MGVHDPIINELFELCRNGDTTKVTNWISARNKKSKSPLNFLRPTTPCPGWLTTLREPTTSYTVLHQSARHGHCELTKFLIEQDKELVTAKDRRGCLPVHLAVFNGHADVVEVLIKSDPNTTNALNNAKECPLHVATQNGHAACVSLLLQNRANPLLRNARFETALDIAARMGKSNICKLLICYSPELINQNSNECFANDNRASSSKVLCPLHMATKHGHLDCVRVLCESGFDVNYHTTDGSALHIAVMFCQVDVVEFLIRYGINLSLTDYNGKTALDKANDLMDDNSSTSITSYSKERLIHCRNLIQDAIISPIGNSGSTIKSNNSDNNTTQFDSAKGVIWRELPENSSILLKRLSEKNSTTLNDHNQSHSPSAPKTNPRISAPSMIVDRRRVPHTMGKNEPGKDHTCNYQAPPLYDAWILASKNSGMVYKNVEEVQPGGANQLPLSYDNVPRNLFVYDNAPPPTHRRWEHNCCSKDKECTSTKAKQDSNKSPTNTSSNGCVKFADVSHESKTKSDRRQAKLTRPSLLQAFGVDGPISERNDCDPMCGHIPSSDDISVSAYDRQNGNNSRISPNIASEQNVSFLGDAPLATSEESGPSTSTSLMSISSSDRNAENIYAKSRRYREGTLSTSTANTRSSSTLIDEDSPDNSVDRLTQTDQNTVNDMSNKHLLLETFEMTAQKPFVPENPTRPEEINVNSPNSTTTSENTLASSCSLQAVSQLSSTPSSTSENISRAGKERGHRIPNTLHTSPNMDKLQACLAKGPRTFENGENSPKKDNKQNEQHATMDHSAEWRQIDEILNAIQRDSFFKRKDEIENSDEFKPLTLQNSTYVVTKVSANGKNTARKSPVVAWLVVTGIPQSSIYDIGMKLENNGFDNVELMKGSLTPRFMTEMDLDLDIQKQLSNYMALKMRESIPSIANFEYLSDWLESLSLMDHLGAFAKANLTYTSDIIAARLTRSDLEKMGISTLGHIARIIRSLELAKPKFLSTPGLSLERDKSVSGSESCTNCSRSDDYFSDTCETSKYEAERAEERRMKLLDDCVSFSASYLGSVEISNVEGADDCRRAMAASKKRITQVNKVPQVLLEISVSGVNVVDATTNKLTVHHEINRILIVYQDELDLNCFAYIYKDGEKNFCHVRQESTCAIVWTCVKLGNDEAYKRRRRSEIPAMVFRMIFGCDDCYDRTLATVVCYAHCFAHNGDIFHVNSVITSELLSKTVAYSAGLASFTQIIRKFPAFCLDYIRHQNLRLLLCKRATLIHSPLYLELLI